MSKTYGEQFKEAMACRTQEQADEWFARELEEMTGLNGKSRKENAAILRSNLGYMAGYYDKSASEHVARFFGANHPIFGAPDYRDKVTPEEAFQAGVRFAKGERP